jgi:hypothetical protein
MVQFLYLAKLPLLSAKLSMYKNVFTNAQARLPLCLQPHMDYP